MTSNIFRKVVYYLNDQTTTIGQHGIFFNNTPSFSYFFFNWWVEIGVKIISYLNTQVYFLRFTYSEDLDIGHNNSNPIGDDSAKNQFTCLDKW